MTRTYSKLFHYTLIYFNLSFLDCEDIRIMKPRHLLSSFDIWSICSWKFVLSIVTPKLLNEGDRIITQPATLYVLVCVIGLRDREKVIILQFD